MTTEAPRGPYISVSSETTTRRLPSIVTVNGYWQEGQPPRRVQLYVNPAEIRAMAAFLESAADEAERGGEVDRVMELPWEGGDPE